MVTEMANNVLVCITEIAGKYICHGNGNKWRVCFTETKTMYVFVSRKCWIHLVREASAGVLKFFLINHMEEISLQFRRRYIKHFNAKRIQKCSIVYPTSALTTVNTAGNILRLYRALSQEAPANLYLRRDLASLCLVSIELSSSPSTFYIAFAL